MTMHSVMPDVDGQDLNAEDREILQHPLVGGLILFSRNYDNPKQLADLIRQIREVRPHALISVDHEGGRVQRFRDGFTDIPPMASLGRMYAERPETALAAARQCGWLLASELLAYGIDLAFAPVLDLDFGVSAVIGDRAFHQQPEEAGRLAAALAAGMREAGMAATGKHFPGHGAIEADSHHALPVDERPLAEIMATDVLPYRQLIREGLESIMPAHVQYTQVDELPAGFSTRWIKDILRDELGFAGAVFSDDLSMAGAEFAGDYTARANAAISAGCDVLLVCNNRAGAVQVLDQLPQREEPERLKRIAQLHGRRGAANYSQLQADERWRSAQQSLASLTAYV